METLPLSPPCKLVWRLSNCHMLIAWLGRCTRRPRLYIHTVTGIAPDIELELNVGKHMCVQPKRYRMFGLEAVRDYGSQLTHAFQPSRGENSSPSGQLVLTSMYLCSTHEAYARESAGRKEEGCTGVCIREMAGRS